MQNKRVNTEDLGGSGAQDKFFTALWLNRTVIRTKFCLPFDQIADRLLGDAQVIEELRLVPRQQFTERFDSTTRQMSEDKRR